MIRPGHILLPLLCWTLMPLACHVVAVEPSLPKEQAVAIAKQDVLKRGWEGSVLVNATVVGGVWQIELRHEPPVVGFHATLQISMDGKVLRIIRGK